MFKYFIILAIFVIGGFVIFQQSNESLSKENEIKRLEESSDKKNIGAISSGGPVAGDVASNLNNSEIKNYGKEAYDEWGYSRGGYTGSSSTVAKTESSGIYNSPNFNPDKRVSEDENDVFLVSEEAVSTFSIDVDSGSYDLYRQEIANYYMHPEYIKKADNAIRVEEFINAFNYNYTSPDSLEKPFLTHFETMKSPWSTNTLLKIGIQGYEPKMEELPPINLVFLVDVSGSMRSELSSIRKSLENFSQELRPDDRISIVTYAGYTNLALKNTKASERDKVLSAINSLRSQGSTNGESGIIMAYEQAEAGYIEGGINKVILMSDGDFNVGQTDAPTLEDMIKNRRENGVEFSTIGFNTDGSGYNDNLMEKMSNFGNGHYVFVGSALDIENFSNQVTKSLMSIAKDVKIQVEFNPNRVKEYRLIGYENRMLNKEDFNNDKVDAGDLMAGSNVTAIYELTFVGDEGLIDDYRYQENEAVSDKDNEIAFVKIRYKKPEEETSNLLEFPVSEEILSQVPSDNMKLAVSIAGFGQVLRQSDYVSKDYSFDVILDSVQGIKDDDFNGQRAKLIEIIKTRKAID
jgi:Ca-activated chloride channel family protein